MAVVGIDFGAANFTVAQAAGLRNAGRGGISIVLNEGTSRFTPGLVTFHENKRHIGQLAAPLKRAQFKKTITNIKRLIGRKYKDKGVAEELKRCFFDTVEMDNGKIGCVVEHNGKKCTFTPTQILAMQFNNIVSFTKQWSGKAKCDFVCSVPSYFGIQQRLAVRDAATIAGVSVLRLLNEGSAAALGYGIFKSDLDEKKPQHVMFVDMGYAQYTVSVVAFTQNGLQVVGSASNPNIGGRNFDEAIADVLADEFKKQSGVDIRTISSKKSWIKLLEAAEKLKKTLTPNGVNEAQCGLECLYQEHDFRGRITQESFDKMFAHIAEQIPTPIKEALRMAKLTAADITSVQLLGGSTRIPLVRKQVAETMGTPMDKQNFGLSCTLNPDECVARGCALQSAILSPLLRVRPYSIKSCITHPIRISWMQPSATGDSAQPQSINLFKAGDPFPAFKRVTFKRKGAFTINATYVNPLTTDKNVGDFEIGGHEDMKTLPDAKIKVNIAYDPDGIFNVKSACFMKEKPPEPEPEPEPEKPKEEAAAAKPKTTDKAPESEAKKPDAGAAKAKESGEGKAPEADAKAEGSKTKAAEEGKPKDGKPEDGKPKDEKPEEKKPPKPKFVQVGLGVKSKVVGALPTAKIDAYRNREAGLAQEERIARERDERRNDLETYVYDIRDKIESYDFESYMLPDAREKYVARLEDEENWLYTDEGNDSTKKVYVDKLADLRVVGDRVLQLKHQRENIPEALENFKVAKTKDLSIANSEDEQYSHITKEERETVRSTWSKGLESVEAGMAKNAALKNHEDLAITIADIIKKQAECAAKCRPTLTKPKPKPKPKPKAEEAKKEEGKTSDGKAEEGKADAPEAGAAKPDEAKADAAGAAEAATSAEKAGASTEAEEAGTQPPAPDEVD